MIPPALMAKSMFYLREQGKLSVAYLQRKLQISYSQAKEIIDKIKGKDESR